MRAPRQAQSHPDNRDRLLRLAFQLRNPRPQFAQFHNGALER